MSQPTGHEGTSRAGPVIGSPGGGAAGLLLNRAAPVWCTGPLGSFHVLSENPNHRPEDSRTQGPEMLIDLTWARNLGPDEKFESSVALSGRLVTCPWWPQQAPRPGLLNHSVRRGFLLLRKCDAEFSLKNQLLPGRRQALSKCLEFGDFQA